MLPRPFGEVNEVACVQGLLSGVDDSRCVAALIRLPLHAPLIQGHLQEQQQEQDQDPSVHMRWAGPGSGLQGRRGESGV